MVNFGRDVRGLPVNPDIERVVLQSDARAVDGVIVPMATVGLDRIAHRRGEVGVVPTEQPDGADPFAAIVHHLVDIVRLFVVRLEGFEVQEDVDLGAAVGFVDVAILVMQGRIGAVFAQMIGDRGSSRNGCDRDTENGRSHGLRHHALFPPGGARAR